MAASVDLEDLVPDLVTALTIPGEDTYGNVSPTRWVDYLRNGFWEAVLDGLLADYTESDGEVTPTPISGLTDPIPRDQQQLIILYTGISILRNKLMTDQSLFRAKAGPVEYEVQYSAQIRKALLDDLTGRRDAVIARLVAAGQATNIFYFDTYAERQRAYNDGLTRWIGA